MHITLLLLPLRLQTFLHPLIFYPLSPLLLSAAHPWGWEEKKEEGEEEGEGEEEEEEEVKD